MQVPERLALIGGSILLSSTLVFTLKGQASSIIPQVSRSIGNVYQDITNTNAQYGALSFDDAFQNAQKQGWTTGQWGTSKYYIDNNDNMYIGNGRLTGPLYRILGSQIEQVRTINFTGHVQAPQDSQRLLSNMPRLTGYQNLNNLDTTSTSEIQGMFSSNPQLKKLDIQGLSLDSASDGSFMFYHDDNLKEVHGMRQLHADNLRNVGFMFAGDRGLSDMDLSSWRTGSLHSMQGMFAGMNNLRSLNLDGIDTTTTDLSNLLGYTHDDSQLATLTLGSHTYLHDNIDLNEQAQWQNGSRSLHSNQLNDNDVHPGTWTRQ